jgi:hypothetical protein
MLASVFVRRFPPVTAEIKKRGKSTLTFERLAFAVSFGKTDFSRFWSVRVLLDYSYMNPRLVTDFTLRHGVPLCERPRRHFASESVLRNFPLGDFFRDESTFHF